MDKIKRLKIVRRSILLLSLLISFSGCGKNKKEDVNENQSQQIETTTEIPLSEQKNNIDNEINNGDLDMAKEDAKKYFTNTVDFIFYGKVVNGTTFDKLSDEAKEEILKDLEDTDARIKEFDPNYKETLGEKYRNFKNDTSDSVRNLIGDDTYEKVGDMKDKAWDAIKDGASDASDYVKEHSDSWYRNKFKN